MKWIPLFGWGVVIYSVIFTTWSGLVLYNFTGGIVSRLIVLVALVAVVTVAGKSLGLRAAKDVFIYSAAWMLAVIGLDAVFTLPYTGVAMYSDWNIWVGYLLVLLVPPLAATVHPRSTAYESA